MIRNRIPLLSFFLLLGWLTAACAPVAATLTPPAETLAPPAATEPPPAATEPPAAETVPPIDTEVPLETASPEPTAAPSIADQLVAVDRMLENLEFANLAFNAPETLNLNQTSMIQLLLSPKEAAETLKQQITAEGQKETARIRISNQMEARLTGLGFEIEAITPEIQAVSAEQTTEWKWQIKPTQTGDQQLHLTLSALVYLENQTMPRVIRTFEETIDVNVTLSQQVSSFFAHNWQWLWTAILIPIVGWLISKRRKLPPN
jgi:hypothetical protein